jgi:hypothetical protein
MERFTSKPPNDNQRAYVMKNQLVSGQLAKKPSKLSSGRDTIMARTSPGRPRMTVKPRASSLIVRSRNE